MCSQKEYRWVILLIASSFFYVYNSFQYTVFIIVSILTIYFAARSIDSITNSTRAFLKSKKTSGPGKSAKHIKRLQTQSVNVSLLLH